MSKLSDWNLFQRVVFNHIKDYTIPQYGDTGNDLATNYSYDDCVRAITKYVCRAGRNSRPGQDKLDCLKIAHYAQMAYNKLEENEMAGGVPNNNDKLYSKLQETNEAIMKSEIEPLHTTKKFGQELSPTVYLEQLSAIEVKIFDAPTISQFRTAISVFMMNTWNDELNYGPFDDAAIDKCIHELFSGNILPTGMEIIGICWGVSGLDMIDTTHLIRHRMFSFSAQAHGDRDMRDDKVMVKGSILDHPTFFDRYSRIVELSRHLYVDMMDSGEIHGLDARTIMPRCFEHFYMVRCCIKDLIGYVNLRKDEQIQTQVDNIVAMKLWLEVLKLYPFLKPYVNFNDIDHFYVKQCKAGKTNIFPPNKKNNCFNYKPEQFYHTKGRDEYIGSRYYLELREHLLNEMDKIK